MADIPTRVMQARTTHDRYIAAAVAQAQYEVLPDDGSIYATIPGLHGVWAQAKTCEGAQAELADVLEGWLALSLERHRPVPVIAGVDWNPPADAAYWLHLTSEFNPLPAGIRVSRSQCAPNMPIWITAPSS